MKSPAIVLMCVLLLATGCERRKAAETPPEGYDPDASPAPSFLDTEPDEDLLGDQAAISRRIERDKLLTAAPGEPAEGAPEAPAEGAASEQVKETLAAIITDVQAGQTERLLDMFTDQGAATMRPLLEGPARIQAKTEALEELITTTIGIEMPEDIKTAFATESKGSLSEAQLKEVSIEDLTFREEGENVIVSGFPDGEDLTFTPGEGGYKVALPGEIEGMVPVFTSLITAQETFIDEMTEAIETGQITAENFEAKAKEIMDRTVTPAFEEYMELITSGMAEGFETEMERDAPPPPEEPTD